MKQEFTRVAVKVGSNVLTRQDGTLDVTRMSALVDQIAELHKDGVEVILISSGAVASGKSEIRTTKKLDSVDQRQLFSAVGQAKLINRYYELFRDHNIPVGQVLTTKESFGTRRHYLNQKNCMTVMLENGVLPIVNENDTISVTELMFTDNDGFNDGRTGSYHIKQHRRNIQRFPQRSFFLRNPRNRTWRRSVELHSSREILFWKRRNADKDQYCP